MKEWNPDILQENLDKGEKVFLKLWKKGCGACKLSIPATDRLEQEDTSGIQFGQILVDDYPEMLEIADTEVLPAFFVFANQRMVGHFVGFKGLAKLQEFLKESLAKA
jgi:thioredoxin-like negative regulator of GroEL